MNIISTGSAGFISSALIAASDAQVTVIDKSACAAKLAPLDLAGQDIPR